MTRHSPSHRCVHVCSFYICYIVLPFFSSLFYSPRDVTSTFMHDAAQPKTKRRITRSIIDRDQADPRRRPPLPRAPLPRSAKPGSPRLSTSWTRPSLPRWSGRLSVRTSRPRSARTTSRPRSRYGRTEVLLLLVGVDGVCVFEGCVGGGFYRQSP